MSYKIDQRKVNGVVIEANAALTNKDFNHGEIMIGLAELVGRVIVEVAENPIQATELTKVAKSHIDNTVRIGAQATEKRIITEA
jgi:hypothetical protein